MTTSTDTQSPIVSAASADYAIRDGVDKESFHLMSNGVENESIDTARSCASSPVGSESSAASGVAMSPSPTSPTNSNIVRATGLSFAELLKQNISSSDLSARNINSSVPIISIPGSMLPSSDKPHTKSDKKGNLKAGKNYKSSGPASSNFDRRVRNSSRRSGHTLNLDSFTKPEHEITRPLSPPSLEASTVSDDHATNGSKSLSVSSSPAPVVNVWKARMSMSSIARKSDSYSDPGTGLETDHREIEEVSSQISTIALNGSAQEESCIIDDSELFTGKEERDFSKTSVSSNEHSNGEHHAYRRRYDRRSSTSPSTHSSSRGRGRGYGSRSGRSQRLATPPSQTLYFSYPYVDVETLKLYILNQVEYYFSVENLCRDIFFRNHMDEEGFININLIAGFNRMKTLTTDAELVKEALQASTSLEVVDMKVRRKDDWQMWLLPKQDSLESGPETVENDVEEYVEK